MRCQRFCSRQTSLVEICFHFLPLTLEDASGRTVSTNFYWLSTREDVLLWPLTQWYFTPTLVHADFRALQDLPPAELQVSALAGKSIACFGERERSLEPSVLAGKANVDSGGRERLLESSVLPGKATGRSGGKGLLPESAAQQGEVGGEGSLTAVLRNSGDGLAFLVRLRLLKGASGEEVLPIRWEDNYFSLLPGEERQLEASFGVADLGGLDPVLEVSGWNVPTLLEAALRE